MKRRKGWSRDVAERERRALTRRALAYKPEQGNGGEPTAQDRRIFCRDNSDEVAAAEAYARERRIERELELAAAKPEKRRGMKIVGGREN